MRANLTYAASEAGNEDLAGGLHPWSRGGSGAIGGETAMWTQWGVVAFVGVAGLALVACGSRAD